MSGVTSSSRLPFTWRRAAANNVRNLVLPNLISGEPDVLELSDQTDAAA